MGQSWTVESFREELAKMGEAEVRRSVAAQRWGGLNDDKQRLAITWLEELDETKAEAKFQASLAIQRDMLKAAQEAAASAAAQAATAKLALGVALLAVIVSFVTAIFAKS